jgi:hypothetical protein
MLRSKTVYCLTLFGYFISNNPHSSSFFQPRSITHNATFELALSTFQIYRDERSACSPFSLYLTPFLMQTNNSKLLTRYLLPNNTCALNIQEDGTGNIGSLWLNLVAPPGLNYSSNLCLTPKRTAAGTYCYARFDAQPYAQHIRNEVIRNAWASISFAVAASWQNIRPHEVRTGDLAYGTVPGIATGIQAFNNPAWRYGKLCPFILKNHGVDDIQLKFGTNLYSNDRYVRISPYIVATAGTGKAPTAEFLFEPLIGTTHNALGAGLNADYILGQNDTITWCIMTDFKYRHLFSGCETRSFDLSGNGDWSRYMLLVHEDATSVSFPAINVCTVPIKVTPGDQIEYWLALHRAHGHWHAELGYNLWWRTSDHNICPLTPFPADTGIYDLAGAVSGTPVSASKAHISQSAVGPNIAPSDAVFTPSSLLNFTSGSQLHALTNSVYLAFSYNREIYCCPVMLGAGGGYEHATRNALAQGSVWGKVGIRF